jgi:hypothetical protein
VLSTCFSRWRLFLLPHRQTFLSKLSSDLSFDPLEGSDLLEAFLGARGHIVMGQLIEFAVRVRPTVRQSDGRIIP